MQNVVHEAQVQAFRRMSLAERIRLNASLWDHARALKEAALRERHPAWTDREIQMAATEALQRAGR